MNPFSFCPPVARVFRYGPMFSLLCWHTWGAEPTPEELLSYASALATKGQVVKVGPEGIVLRGESIEGVPTRRPADAIARAAELTMEAAIASKNPMGMTKAIALWKGIDQENCAIPYLRMASKGTDSFSGYCLSTVAVMYAESGDMESAKAIFDRFDATNIRDDLDAYSVAQAARFSLSIGEAERAGLLARAVTDRSDPNKFSGYGGDVSFSIATSVLKALPGASPSEDVRAIPVRGEALERARTALAAKDYESAIAAFLEHRRLMPSEPSAREALLQAANLAEKLRQTDRALGLYREAEVQYSAYPEGWKAAMAAANLLESQGNLQEALKSAESSLAKAKIPESAAWLTLKVAELSAQAKDVDRAAALYAELLSMYAAQDASRDAFKRLESAAPQIKDWKKLARRLQEVASANDSHFTSRDLSRLPGLRAATTLATIPGPSKRKNRELESALRAMMDSEYKADARSLLLRYYEFHGDTRSIQGLKELSTSLRK